jgi:rhodanese-related sulfurtransferase
VALTLKKAGITNVLALIGGYEQWLERGDPVVKGSSPR